LARGFAGFFKASGIAAKGNLANGVVTGVTIKPVTAANGVFVKIYYNFYIGKYKPHGRNDKARDGGKRGVRENLL
jgi:hypothetical protein